jgi:sugar phosphate isomerase/epimerase
MKRREFLMTAGAVAGLTASGRLWAAQAANAKLARIGISSRNFGAIIKMGNIVTNPAARTLDPLDFAQMIADKFGVHNLELQHAHFMSTEPAYLKELKDRVSKAKSQIVQISTEFYNSNASSSAASLRQSGDLAKQWIDHAAALGCPRVLVNAGPLGENVRATTALESLKLIDAYAKTRKVSIAVENMDNGVVPPAPPAPPPAPPKAAPAPPKAAPDAAAGGAAPAAGRRAGGGGGGAAAAPAGGGGGGRGNAPARPASWQVISEVAKAAGVLVTPNFAGFPSEAERVAGLKVLIPMSNGNCHVSMDPGKIDFAAGIKLCQDAGYKGLYTIAIAESAADPSAATKTTLDELLKLI